MAKVLLDPAQLLEQMRMTRASLVPELRYSKTQGALWYRPACAESQLAVWDAARSRGSVCTSVHGRFGRVGACEDEQVTGAVDALDLLVQRGCHIPSSHFFGVLKRCVALKDLLLCRRMHALAVTCGYDSNAILANQLICIYASHGSLVEALQVFSQVSAPDVYLWASIILAYARHGKPTQAVRLYQQMRESAVKPDNHIFVAVLKACATAGDLAAGKEVHAHVLASPVKPNMFVLNSLVDMYAKCGSLEDAKRVFDGILQKNVVTWTAMIAGYTQQGLGEEALGLYARMQQEGITSPSSFTFACLLQACAIVGVEALRKGKQLHAQIEGRGLRRDAVVSASLVNMYAKCGSLEDAQRVFYGLAEKNVVTWNTMIAGYAQQGMGVDALSLYSSMLQEAITEPDAITFACLLQACASLGAAALDQGKQLHGQVEERGLLGADRAVGNGVVNMYAKCGSLEDARRVFDRLPHRGGVATWNAMIGGYAQHGMGLEALTLYSSMQQEAVSPDSVTFVCLLQACANVGALHEGEQIHAQIQDRGLEADEFVGSSLVNLYAKCGSLENAQTVFDGLLQKDVVTWTAMIAGYAQQGLGEEALSLYRSMQQEGLTPPNSVTFVCLLQACASVAALPLGKQLHAQIEGLGWQADEVVGPSLVNMYAKCGSLDAAQQVFDSLPARDAVAWGALISGYARRGDCATVFHLVDRMRLEGSQADGATLVSVLTVCSHVGLVDKGREYFAAMSRDHGITPSIEHYTCMMDLLGRAGHLDEALQMVKTMPFQPNAAVWHTLLAACRKWSNVEIGRQAFEFAVRLDEKDGAAYVLMSNIYAGCHMWEEANEMQAERVKCGAWKEPGRSWWTDNIAGVLHSFVV